jgi:hypothetical protein
MTQTSGNDDLEGGRADRDQGMARALAAHRAWQDEAWRVLMLLASTGEPFTSEDITAVAGLPQGGISQHGNNAVGALMSGASRAGVIVPTGHTQSRRRVSHAAHLREWKGSGR